MSPAMLRRGPPGLLAHATLGDDEESLVAEGRVTIVARVVSHNSPGMNRPSLGRTPFLRCGLEIADASRLVASDKSV
jgi:hypothetical protein